MAMLSVAIIFYALLRAQRTDYTRNDCILLAVGIILCAMSYYNAYGIIVAAILIFAIRYIHVGGTEDMTNGSRRKRLWIEWRPLLQKGCFISVIVLAGISWWFIRNAVLYDGDIVAMNARRECAIETAIPDYNPLTRFTYQNSGTPLSEMLFGTGYLTLLRDSFIAMFGPMIIPTHGLIYLFYKRFWIVAGLVAVLPIEKIWKQERKTGRKQRVVFYSCMTLFCAITIALSIYYSYTWEFQPQGRYILPVLIPLMYLVTLGVEKIYRMIEEGLGWLAKKKAAGDGQKKLKVVGSILAKCFSLGVMAYVMLAFAYSLLVRFIPYYMDGTNMFSMYGKPFVP